MKINWLMATAVAAVLASTGWAGAQGMNERGGTAPGATQKSAPSQKGPETGKRDRAPSPRAGKQKDQTTGQSPQADRPPGSSKQGQRDQMQRQKPPSGAAQQGRDKSRTTGQSPDPQRQPRTGADQKPRKEQRGGAQQKQDREPGRAQQKRDERRTGAPKSETVGKGDARDVNLSVEQRTRIRQIVVSKKIPKVDKVTFTVSVGAKVPRTVRFHPIPAEIVTIRPAWRGYRVILVGSELVIVHPTTYEIVAVIVV